MRVSSFAVARPAPADRNGLTTTQSYGPTTVASHGGTVRFSFTVATGKKVSVLYTQVFVQRATAATVDGLNRPTIAVTPSGSVQTTLVSLPKVSNTVDNSQTIAIGTSLSLNAGDYVEASSFDVATGGTITLFIAMNLLTYDA